MTGSGNYLSLTITGVMLNREDIPYVSTDDRKPLCGECKGFNGGCPPYAPPFDKIKPSCDQFYVICVMVDMLWSTLYAGGKLNDKIETDGDKIRLNMYRIVYIDRLTKRYVSRIVRDMEERTACYGLFVGNCIGCTGSCAVASGGKCVNPQKRTYSMEAAGIECSSLHELIFKERLPWWYRTVQLPTYMARYCGLFVGRGYSESYFDQELQMRCEADKSFVTFDVHDVHRLLPDSPVVELVVPDESYDAGMKYAACEVFNE